MKKLQRLPHKGTFAGVLAGCAEYFQIDVTLLRLLFVLFVIFTGFFPGVLAYICAMLIMPVGGPVIHEQE